MVGVCQRAVQCVREKPPNPHFSTTTTHSYALERELRHNTSYLQFALVASAYNSGDNPTTTALGATMEAFSDDLKFKAPKILPTMLAAC